MVTPGSKIVGFVCPLDTKSTMNTISRETGIGLSKLFTQASEEFQDRYFAEAKKKELKKIVRKARPYASPMTRRRRGNTLVDEASRAMGIQPWRARQIVAGVRE